MTDQKFKIEVDRRELLVRLTLFGLWDVGTVDQYAAAAKSAFADLIETGARIDKCKALIDLRRHGVQSREVTNRIQSWLGLALSDGARHAVLVSESMLHRLQAQRVGSALGASFFSDEASALAWLMLAETDAPLAV